MLISRVHKLLGAIILLLSVFTILPLSTQSQIPVAYAANGDLIHTTRFSSPCASGLGVGIAFDGEFLWYSCYSSNPDLYKAEALTGNVVASYNVAGGLGALAWDGNSKKIWAGWGGGAGANGDVRLIDPTTGSATVVFNAAAAVIVGLDDGLAYDAQDDSLYISDDVSTTIYHYSKSGTLLNSFQWAGNSCYNSGLAIGGELLFQGSNGCNHIWVVTRSDLSPAFNFPTGGTRDEDLECDSVTFSPRTVMWSMEAYDENRGDNLGRRAIAFEIPSGSCATGGGVDSDSDGLLDEWETNGVTIDPDGDGPVTPQFIDLSAMGADRNRPDIFLQIDWMRDDSHSHQLDPRAIRRVVEAFDSSPYSSPTGSTGINLHVDQGPDSILNFETNATWGSLSRARALTEVNPLGTGSGNSYNWNAFDQIKNQPGGFTQSGRTPIFHYVISAHNYGSTESSGISRGIGASDLVVSLGSFPNRGTISQQAGTLMHELGHNLNLCHGGPANLASPEGQCNINYKPNYLSIMNYSFQLEGVIRDGVGTLDYSRSALPTLHEGDLNEATGLGADAATYGTRHFCSFLFGVSNVWAVVINANEPIDWNCDDDTSDNNISYNINGEDGSNQDLIGYNDWTNLKFKGGAIGLAGIVPDLPTETEEEQLTPEVAQRILPITTIVPIDIWPFLHKNIIIPSKNHPVPVAVLSTDDFDAPSQLDVNSLTFGKTGDEQSLDHCAKIDLDVNDDDLFDLICVFRSNLTGFQIGDTEGILKGRTLDGIPIEGRDSVWVVPPRKTHLFKATLKGSGEVPPVTTKAVGNAVFSLNKSETKLSFILTLSNIKNVTAVHVHCAPLGENGPVGVTLFSGGPTAKKYFQGTITTPDAGNGCGWTDLASVVTAMRSGDTYVNVHTTTYPSGETRGQIKEAIR